MTTYFIRHNQDHSYIGNRSFWYSDYFETPEAAADAIRTRNDLDCFLGWREIEEQVTAIHELSKEIASELSEHYQVLIDRLREYSPSDATTLTMQVFDCNHNLVWTEGETSFDFGDFTESIEAVECDDPAALRDYLHAHPHQSCDLEWVIKNELTEDEEEEEDEELAA